MHSLPRRQQLPPGLFTLADHEIHAQGRLDAWLAEGDDRHALGFQHFQRLGNVEDGLGAGADDQHAGARQFGQSMVAGLMAWGLTSSVFVGLCLAAVVAYLVLASGFPVSLLVS